MLQYIMSFCQCNNSPNNTDLFYLQYVIKLLMQKEFGGLIKRENNCKRDFVKKSFLSLLCFIFLEMPKKFYIFLLKGKGMAKNISSYERFGINQYFYVIRMLKILKFCHWSKGSFYRKQKSFMNLESDLFLFMDGILMRIISCVCIKRRIKTWNIKSILSIGNI